MFWSTVCAIQELACRWEVEAAASRGPEIRVQVSSFRCLYRCRCRFPGQCRGDGGDLSTLQIQQPDQRLRRLHNNGLEGMVVEETSWPILLRQVVDPSTMLRRSVTCAESRT